MMKNFLSTFFGAMVGTFVAMFLATVIMTVMSIMMFAMSAMSLGSGAKSDVSISKDSVLLLDLSGGFEDRPAAEDAFAALFNGGDVQATYTYDQLVKALKVAKDNDNIKGVVIKANGLACGMAKGYEVHLAIEKFKNESDKWVYAYGDNYSQGEYYLASLADSVFINREGSVDLKGLASQIPYFKGALDKLGVKAEIFKVGTFKSAVEPYMLEHISDANKLQTSQYLASIWNTLSTAIANARGVEVSAVNSWVEDIAWLQPTDYLINNKIVDRKVYDFEFTDIVRQKLNVEKEDDINYVTIADAASVYVDKTKTDGKIAVLYAQGEINSASDDAINYNDINEYILDAADDDDIKGLVFRVNSPGGSAFDSEQMWAAIEKFKAAGKVVAVSMGDYAASGGYYISCGANRIFAQPTTITGSIGIYGMLFNFSQVAQNVGVNFELVSTHNNSIMSQFNEMPAPLKAQFQTMVNNGYELFTTRCATGRDMPLDSLLAIAEGRVWAGNTALEIGLVDELGGVEEAIAWVASQVGIEHPEVVNLQDGDEDMLKALRKMLKRNIVPSFGVEIDALATEAQHLVEMAEESPLQARMFDRCIW